MDNIRAVLGILFGHVSEQEVFWNKVSYDNVPLDTFMALANSYMPRYSNDEIQNLYHYLESELKWMRHKIYYEDDDGEKAVNINVFDVLYLFSGEVLTEEKGQPVCQYLHFLRWNEMSREIGEDSLITAFLAFKDSCFERKRTNFFWKPVIGHNSQALNRILEKGIAENHFHLKGSAPLFHVSWISMMNNVADENFRKTLDEYGNRRLKRNVAYNSSYMENPLSVLYLRAASIRMYLFQYLIEEKVDRAEFLDHIKDSFSLECYIDELQELIDFYQDRYNEYDYAICKVDLVKENTQRVNEILVGERWFLYAMFQIVYSRKKDKTELCQLFYHYLIIKNMIRAEMIQVNENVGFDNFLLYQQRKDQFVENTKYEPIYIKMAVRDTILNQHIQKLEARITPKDTCKENERNICKLDNWIAGSPDELCKLEELDQQLLSRYFYVMHFIKEPDNEEERYEDDLCRHYAKRKEIEKQAKAFVMFRESGSEWAKRIYGIDASSAEISCRPGVFAQAFRYLKNHRGDMNIPQLRATYHVGEDFLDIIDGLRAIDEAILFLNLKCGDRLGHALALGIDIDDWYKQKANLLLISKMNYLDNLVWLYHKIRKYRLKDCEDASHFILKRYDELVRYVYKKHVSHTEYIFSIESYYDSWKLRGDNPENYADGHFKIKNAYADEWDYHAINREFPTNYKIRYDEEVAYLYYLFHYNREVKLAGDEMIEVYVNPALIHAVKLVQKRMQIDICERGIGIETNPSSNCYIGSFKRYDKHPIRKWYNYGLTNDQEELEECPQLLLSINTDDQGVFNTYLENEYAYLALALEKLKNEDGTPKYKRTMILRWLDNIREMGLDQSFL